MDNLTIYQKKQSYSQEQTELSLMLFGTVIKQNIHLTQQDLQDVSRIRQTLKKYEVSNADYDMLD